MARRSKRRSNRAGRLGKTDQDSRPKSVRLKLDAKAPSRMVVGRGTSLPTLPNMQDNWSFRNLPQLASAASPSIILVICFAKRKSRLAKITS